MVKENAPLLSLLWRRKTQYAQMNTIFRRESRPAVSAAAAGPVARAFFQAAPTALPQGRLVSEMGKPAETETEWTAVQRAIAAAEAPPLPAVPSWMNTGSASPRPAAPSPAVSSPPPAPAASPPPAADDDPTWNRLKNILRRHEQKKAAGESAPPQPPPAAKKSAASPSPAAPETPPSAPSLPLEQAWPVQRRAAEPPAAPAVVSPPEMPPGGQPPPDPAEIQAKIGGVAAGRATDSSIELHLPRRPRPPVSAAQAGRDEANRSFWERVRRSAETPPRDVPTEIGPLPSDLWEMLGETPPDQHPAVPAQETAAPAGAAQRAAANAQTAPLPALATEKPESVQRAAETPPPPPETAQRAVAAAEAPPPPPETKAAERPARPSAPSAPSAPPGAAPAPRPEAVQRAIAAAEAPPPPPETLPRYAIRRNVVYAPSGEKEQIPPLHTAVSSTPPREESTPRPVEFALPARPTVAQRTAAPATTAVPTVVQRDDDDNNAPDEIDDDRPGDSSDPDIDQLARQVYTQLKRRLAVDWERSRGKR